MSEVFRDEIKWSRKISKVTSNSRFFIFSSSLIKNFQTLSFPFLRFYSKGQSSKLDKYKKSQSHSHNNLWEKPEKLLLMVFMKKKIKFPQNISLSQICQIKFPRNAKKFRRVSAYRKFPVQVLSKFVHRPEAPEHSGASGAPNFRDFVAPRTFRCF